MDDERLLERGDKIACMGIDRAYEWHMRDHFWFQKKLALIKKRCKPGAMLGCYKVMSVFYHHCLLKSPKGKIYSMTYIELARMVTVRKKSQK